MDAIFWVAILTGLIFLVTVAFTINQTNSLESIVMMISISLFIAAAVISIK